MKNLVNLKYVQEQIKKGYSIWSISASDSAGNNGPKLAIYDKETGSPAASLEEFNEACENIAGVVKVTLKNTEISRNDGTKALTVFVDLGKGETKTINSTEPRINASDSLFAMYLNSLEQISALKIDLLRQELKAENRTDPETMLKTQSQMRLMGMMEKLLTGHGPAEVKKVIAGPSVEQHDQAHNTKAQVLDALSRLDKNTEDLPGKLAKLANLAETNPELYKMMMEQLNSL